MNFPRRLPALVFGAVLFAAPARAAEPLRIPYRLTPTQHVLVRVKIDDRGPVNLILDTGAPMIVLRSRVADLLDPRPKTPGWATLGRVEVEGGAVVEKVQARFEDIYQLEGMNGLKMAGVELDGVLGYNVLSRYKIEYDFTQDKLTWTPSGYRPAVLRPFGGKPGGSTGLDALGGMMKSLGQLFGARAEAEPRPRGFLGLEAVEADGAVRIAAVLPGSPAARAELQTGDQILRLGDADLTTVASLVREIERKAVGDELPMTIRRGDEQLERIVTLGPGF